MKKIGLICLISIALFASHLCYANAKLVILLDWFINPDHAPLLVAEQQGYFKAEGLDVILIGPADPMDPPKLVAANKADIAITYEPQLIEQIAQGLPLIRIGTLIDKPLNCLVVLKKSVIHTMKDLKGKRIGYSSGGMTHVTLKTMLANNGLLLSDVQAINVHYGLTQALLSQQVDAVIGMARTFEVIQMDLASQPARVFLPEKNGIPPYSELVFVVNKAKIHDPRLPKFLAALQQGVTYLKQHPEAAWQVFAKNHPESNNELNHRAWFATLTYFANHPAQLNTLEWQQFITFMQQKGVISTIYPLDHYAITLSPVTPTA